MRVSFGDFLDKKTYTINIFKNSVREKSYFLPFKELLPGVLSSIFYKNSNRTQNEGQMNHGSNQQILSGATAMPYTIFRPPEIFFNNNYLNNQIFPNFY